MSSPSRKYWYGSGSFGFDTSFVTLKERMKDKDNTWIKDCKATNLYRGLVKLDDGFEYYVLFGQAKGKVGKVEDGQLIWTLDV